jgi:hypothetical protein
MASAYGFSPDEQRELSIAQAMKAHVIAQANPDYALKQREIPITLKKPSIPEVVDCRPARFLHFETKIDTDVKLVPEDDMAVPFSMHHGRGGRRRPKQGWRQFMDNEPTNMQRSFQETHLNHEHTPRGRRGQENFPTWVPVNNKSPLEELGWKPSIVHEEGPTILIPETDFLVNWK